MKTFVLSRKRGSETKIFYNNELQAEDEYGAAKLLDVEIDHLIYEKSWKLRIKGGNPIFYWVLQECTPAGMHELKTALIT